MSALDRVRLRSPVAVLTGGGSASVESIPQYGMVAPVPYTSARRELGGALQGRISLAVLNFLILAMIGFYIWTRGVQGGR